MLCVGFGLGSAGLRFGRKSPWNPSSLSSTVLVGLDMKSKSSADDPYEGRLVVSSNWFSLDPELLQINKTPLFRNLFGDI